MVKDTIVLMEAMAVVVAPTNFIAYSRASKEALKSASLLKNFSLNALILGEKGTGKLTLASFVLDAPIVNASDTKKLQLSLKKHKKLIIKDFHLLSQPLYIKELIEENHVQIIATAPFLDEKIADSFFSITIKLLSLNKREEDIIPLAKLFLEEVTSHLSIEPQPLPNFTLLKNHTGQNAHSLKRFVYMNALLNTLEDDEFLAFFEHFLVNKIEKKKEYRELLYLFDIPLIKAGFQKYDSQLSLSAALGLNRNTLRKKINENKDYFKGLL